MESIKNKVETELAIWEKVRLVVGEGREAGLYVARVEDIINGGIVITEPEFISGRTLLRNAMVVIVQITRQDAAYQFYSRIHTQETGESKRVILTPPRRLERVQRRMFARVDLATKVTYAELKDDLDWNDWEQQLTWHQTLSLNISGGGILLKLQEPLKRGRLVVMQIEVFGEADLATEVLAVCRRTFKSEGDRYAGFEYLITSDLGHFFTPGKLSRLPESLKMFSLRMQDRLVTLLFNKQIQLRQKGLL